MVRSGLFAAVLVAAASGAVAQEVEHFMLQGAQVSVILHPFLTEEEVGLLRVVGASPEALELFVPESGRYAALAVAPGDGFIREGIPVTSAVAVGDLPDIEAARSAARAGCDEVRVTREDCEIVLEIRPQ